MDKVIASKPETPAKPQRYRREQLIKSGKFPVDVASAVLRDDVEYTIGEAEKAIQKYYESEV